MQLTKDQVNVILNNAPAGTDKQALLDGLIKRGYDLEGVDSNVVKQQIIEREKPKIERPKTYGEDFVSDIKQIGTEAKTAFQEAQQRTDEIKKAEDTGEQGALRSTFQSLGSGAKFLSSLFGSAVKGGIKAIMPQEVEDVAKAGIQTVAEPVMNTELVKNIIGGYNNLDEKSKRDVDAILGISSLAADVAGLGIGKKGAELGIEQGIKQGAKVLEAGAGIVKPVVEPITNIIKGAKDILEPVARGVSQIPSRIATNVEANKALTTSIKELPTEIAKSAAKNGVDITDLNNLYKITSTATNEEKTALKNLYSVVNNTPEKAVEEVGKPIITKLKELKSKLVSTGKELGTEARNIGTITKEELEPIILNNLRNSKGLEDIVLVNGKLDFSGTSLAGAGSKADRNIIQSYFDDAIKQGTGKQKHLLRQNIYEYLGGKRGITASSATSDDALQSIRRGLADILDSKNAKYKKLNTQYSKIANPVEEMNKLLRNSGFKDVDILNETAGTIARRLTSNAVSKGDIRQILRNLDSATTEGVQITGQVEKLQDLYNILDKYYGLSGATSLKGQIEGASNLKGFFIKKAKEFAGKSDAVIKKAITDAINEALM